MKITLVICTYNRADILKETLPSVYRLNIPIDLSLELIVVDNNSSDNTCAIVKEVFNENKDSYIKAKYVFEPMQGLSYARNKGFDVSSGEYIAYIDDECILPGDWLDNANKIITVKQPAFVGGPYYGKYMPGSSSNWYRESFGDSYILQYNLPNGPMIKRYLSGGNMFIRRDVFEKIGLFDVNLGMSGETINYGEEVELQKRFIEKYPDEYIWYDSSIFVWHCIRAEKMRITFLFKDALIRGESSAELLEPNRNQLKKAPFYLLFFIFRALSSAIKKLFLSIFQKENYFFLLYDDYKNGTWRDIGGALYKVKKLLNTSPR